MTSVVMMPVTAKTNVMDSAQTTATDSVEKEGEGSFASFLHPLVSVIRGQETTTANEQMIPSGEEAMPTESSLPQTPQLSQSMLSALAQDSTESLPDQPTQPELNESVSDMEALSVSVPAPAPAPVQPELNGAESISPAVNSVLPASTQFAQSSSVESEVASQLSTMTNTAAVNDERVAVEQVLETTEQAIENTAPPVSAPATSQPQNPQLLHERAKGIDVSAQQQAKTEAKPVLEVAPETTVAVIEKTKQDVEKVEAWTQQFLNAKNMIKQQVNAEGLQTQQQVKADLNQLMTEQLKSEQSIKLDQLKVEKQAEDLAEFKQVSQSQPSASPKGANAQVFQSQIGFHLKQKEEWNKSFSQKITMMATQDIQRAKISLNPERLGPVEVMVALEGKQARVMIQTAHQEVKEAFKDALPMLESMLNQQGMDLGDCDVYDDSDQSHNIEFAQLWNDDLSELESTEQSTSVQIKTHDGLVDRYA